MGEKRAREFVLNVDAGWSIEKVNEKFPELVTKDFDPRIVYQNDSQKPTVFQVVSLPKAEADIAK